MDVYMSSNNRRVFSLIGLLLFVSLVCLADSAFAGKWTSEDELRRLEYQNALNANK